MQPDGPGVDQGWANKKAMKLNKGKNSVLHPRKEQAHASVPVGIHHKAFLLKISFSNDMSIKKLLLFCSLYGETASPHSVNSTGRMIQFPFVVQELGKFPF